MNEYPLHGADPSLNGLDAGSAPTLAARQPLAPIASSPAEPALPAAAALADQLHIHSLDLTGALQIMIAEVRAELAAPESLLAGKAILPIVDASGGTLPILPAVDVQPLVPPVVVLPLPLEAPHGGGGLEPLLMATGGLPAEPWVATTPQTLVQLFLQALPAPEMLEPAAWLTYVMEVEGAVQEALDRAVQTASGWREVPLAVVDGARETRAMVVAAITDDPPNPLWLRPEWLGLAPRMERYWRRRRRARRWLSDPDLHWRERDEDVERRPATDEP